MKITKRQLRRIIKEERAKLLNEISPADMGMAAAKADGLSRQRPNHGVFDQKYLETLLSDEIQDYLNTAEADFLSPDEAKLIERTINSAVNTVIMDFVR